MNGNLSDFFGKVDGGKGGNLLSSSLVSTKSVSWCAVNGTEVAVGVVVVGGVDEELSSRIEAVVRTLFVRGDAEQVMLPF